MRPMKTDKILILISALSLVAMGIVYFFLPESIPLHWNFAGKVDSWGGRANILWMAALPLVMALALRFLPRIDPKRESYERHARTYDTIKLLLVLCFVAIGWMTVAVSLGLPLDIGVMARVISGLLMIGLGNLMGRLKRNYFVGIKTPWALADDEVWRRTHRRGGYVFVILGMVFLLSLFIPSSLLLEIVIVGTPLAGIAYIYLYSWLSWRKVKGS